MENKSKTFSYVAYDEQSKKISEEIKELCELIEKRIGRLGAGRYQSLALTNLEMCFAMVGKAIRDIQIDRGVQTAHVPERTNE